jgi:hypothetical protein
MCVCEMCVCMVTYHKDLNEMRTIVFVLLLVFVVDRYLYQCPIIMIDCNCKRGDTLFFLSIIYYVDRDSTITIRISQCVVEIHKVLF